MLAVRVAAFVAISSGAQLPFNVGVPGADCLLGRACALRIARRAVDVVHAWGHGYAHGGPAIEGRPEERLATTAPSRTGPGSDRSAQSGWPLIPREMRLGGEKARRPPGSRDNAN
jgi:hypothetical protein